jgi:hypothetical protein
MAVAIAVAANEHGRAVLAVAVVAGCLRRAVARHARRRGHADQRVADIALGLTAIELLAVGVCKIVEELPPLVIHCARIVSVAEVELLNDALVDAEVHRA